MGNCAGGGIGGVGICVGGGIGADVGGGVGCGKLDGDACGGVGGGISVGVGIGVSATTEVGTEVLKGVGGSVGPGKGIGVGTKEGAGLVGRMTAQKSAQRVRCGIGWISPRISGWKRTWIGIWPENQAQHNLNDSCHNDHDSTICKPLPLCAMQDTIPFRGVPTYEPYSLKSKPEERCTCISQRQS